MTRPIRSTLGQTSLEALKKAAKRWLKALRAGDPAALGRYREAYPRGSGTPTLREVQQALAREHGQESWAALKLELEDLAIASRSEAERAAELLELACLHYGVAPGGRTFTGHPEGPERRRRAARILERHPEVAQHGLHAAVVCGDVKEVARILRARPGAAQDRGGREGWEPLLFLCYARLPTAAAADNAVAIATALLDHGADPNSAWTYDWEHHRMRFTALCGAIGDGEKGPVICPPHPQAQALATLLLDRGADPNQGQALYHTMLRGDDDHWLRLLIARGFGPQHPISWEGDRSPTSMFEYLLAHAVTNNQLARAAALLEHGARPVPSNGRSFYQRALLAGNVAMAELLVRHGAPPSELAGSEAFRAACARGDAAAARRLLAEDPRYLDDGHVLLAGAVAQGDLVDVARLLLDLGASPDAEVEGPEGRYRALHQAACVDAVRVAELLIARGADADARDGAFAATPLAWALRVHMSAAIELFSRHSRDVFTLVAGARMERLRTLLQENPAAASQKATAALGLGIIGADPGDTPLHVLPPDEELAIEVAELLLAFGADPLARNGAGLTPAEQAHARGLPDLAEWLTP
jgi:uncharacterized protein